MKRADRIFVINVPLTKIIPRHFWMEMRLKMIHQIFKIIADQYLPLFAVFTAENTFVNSRTDRRIDSNLWVFSGPQMIILTFFIIIFCSPLFSPVSLYLSLSFWIIEDSIFLILIGTYLTAQTQTVPFRFVFKEFIKWLPLVTMLAMTAFNRINNLVRNAPCYLPRFKPTFLPTLDEFVSFLEPSTIHGDHCITLKRRGKDGN